MYNAFAHKKKKQTSQNEKLKSVSLQKFVDNYYSKKRPILLNNYNKRINDFIRKVENEPIVIKQNPYQSNDHKRLSSTIDDSRSLKRKNSSNSSKTNVLQHSHSLSFKFKNTEDWTSLYTPWQRLQRQKNYERFKTKYGDPDIAFRSIGSQSEYHPYHEYRQRNQNLQINPPMRYTNKQTQQVLAKIKSKYAKKQQQIKLKKNNQPYQTILKQNSLMNNSSVASFAGLGQQSVTIGETEGNLDSQKQQQNMVNNVEKKQKIKKLNQNKLYFKQIIDIQQNVKDMGTKKLLRGILQKCGVYRKKNKKITNDVQTDQFSEFQNSGQ